MIFRDFIKNQSAIERENEKHEELQLQKTKVEKLKKDCTLLQSEKKSRIIEIQQQEDLRHEAEAKIDKLENEIKSLRIQNQTYLKEKGIFLIIFCVFLCSTRQRSPRCVRAQIPVPMQFWLKSAARLAA